VVVYGEETKFLTTDFTDDTDWKNRKILEVILNLRASVSIYGLIFLHIVSVNDWERRSWIYRRGAKAAKGRK